MAELRAKVSLAVPERDRAEAVMGRAFRRFADLPLDAGRRPLIEGRPVDSGLALTSGTPGRPGTRYRLDLDDESGRGEVVVADWDHGALSVSVDTSVEAGNGHEVSRTTVETRLIGPEPRVTASGSVAEGATATQPAGGARPTTWTAAVDLERWWRQSLVGRPARGRQRQPAATAAVDHPLAAVSIAASAWSCPPTAGQCCVEVTVTVRGRSWARPVVPLAALVAKRALRLRLVALLRSMAAEWDRFVASTEELDVDAAADLVLGLLRSKSDAAGKPVA